MDDIAGEAAILNNIGQSHSDLGDKQQALDYFSQALPLSCPNVTVHTPLKE